MLFYCNESHVAKACPTQTNQRVQFFKYDQLLYSNHQYIANGFAAENIKTIKNTLKDWMTSQTRFIQTWFANLCWESWVIYIKNIIIYKKDIYFFCRNIFTDKSLIRICYKSLCNGRICTSSYYLDLIKNKSEV